MREKWTPNIFTSLEERKLRVVESYIQHNSLLLKHWYDGGTMDANLYRTISEEMMSIANNPKQFGAQAYLELGSKPAKTHLFKASPKATFLACYVENGGKELQPGERLDIDIVKILRVNEYNPTIATTLVGSDLGVLKLPEIAIALGHNGHIGLRQLPQSTSAADDITKNN